MLNGATLPLAPIARTSQRTPSSRRTKRADAWLTPSVNAQLDALATALGSSRSQAISYAIQHAASALGLNKPRTRRRYASSA